MAIQQISALIENKPGKLSDIFQAIADAKVNIRAMSIADTKEFGILRLIVSDVEQAKAAISDDTVVTVTDVIAVEMNDTAGELCKIIKVLGKQEINIEYTYAFTAPGTGAYTVLRVDSVAEAEKALTEAGVHVLSKQDI